MSDRELILNALLGAQNPSEPPQSRIAQSSSENPSELWQLFARRLEALGGTIATPDDLWQLQSRQIWIDPASTQYTKAIGLITSADIWSAEIGFTNAEFAIAESGSVVVSVGAGLTRRSTLTPLIAVLFVEQNAIVKTLDEAMKRISGKTSAIITGPSRTADIEGTLVRGVHSPGEIWVVPINSPDVE